MENFGTSADQKVHHLFSPAHSYTKFNTLHLLVGEIDQHYTFQSKEHITAKEVNNVSDVSVILGTSDIMLLDKVEVSIIFEKKLYHAC